MNILGIGTIIKSIGAIADDLITTDEERLKIALQEKIIDAQLVKGQLAINAAEAQHKSIFVAGWRPAIGWVGAVALAYQFILYPLLTWLWSYLQAKQIIDNMLLPPPVLPAEALWVIISGMLGIAGMRSYDKRKGTVTDKISRRMAH
ncbi:MAG: hypothetical protein GY874_08630 [Desulfobacteraceae bacterium]|nr:hypothetical protein [Desulfobacteraceae bacterium]